MCIPFARKRCVEPLTFLCESPGRIDTIQFNAVVQILTKAMALGIQSLRPTIYVLKLQLQLHHGATVCRYRSVTSFRSASIVSKI